MSQQLLSWAPERVEHRVADCAYLHHLYTGFDLPARLITVNCHFFLEHYTDRLVRHGNLLGLSDEGGEHQHKVHRDKVNHHKQYARYVCPEVLRKVMRAETTKLWACQHGQHSPTTCYSFGRPPCLAGFPCPGVGNSVTPSCWRANWGKGGRN